MTCCREGQRWGTASAWPAAVWWLCVHVCGGETCMMLVGTAADACMWSDAAAQQGLTRPCHCDGPLMLIPVHACNSMWCLQRGG